MIRSAPCMAISERFTVGSETLLVVNVPETSHFLRITPWA